MNRDRHSKKHNNSSWKNNSKKEEPSYSKQAFRSVKAVSQEQIKADDEAIRLFKSTNQPLCAR